MTGPIASFTARRVPSATFHKSSKPGERVLGSCVNGEFLPFDDLSPKLNKLSKEVDAVILPMLRKSGIKQDEIFVDYSHLMVRYQQKVNGKYEARYIHLRDPNSAIYRKHPKLRDTVRKMTTVLKNTFKHSNYQMHFGSSHNRSFIGRTEPAIGPDLFPKTLKEFTTGAWESKKPTHLNELLGSIKVAVTRDFAVRHKRVPTDQEIGEAQTHALKKIAMAEQEIKNIRQNLNQAKRVVRTQGLTPLDEKTKIRQLDNLINKLDRINRYEIYSAAAFLPGTDIDPADRSRDADIATAGGFLQNHLQQTLAGSGKFDTQQVVPFANESPDLYVHDWEAYSQKVADGETRGARIEEFIINGLMTLNHRGSDGDLNSIKDEEISAIRTEVAAARRGARRATSNFQDQCDANTQLQRLESNPTQYLAALQAQSPHLFQ